MYNHAKTTLKIRKQIHTSYGASINLCSSKFTTIK